MINAILGNTTFLSTVKQVFGILIHSLAFYLLIEYNNRDIKKMFTIYLKISFVVATIGVIQESAYILRNITGKITLPSFNSFAEIMLSPFFDYSYIIPFHGYGGLHFTDIFGIRFLRINSIMNEPYSFCVIMMPTLFVAFASLLNNNFYMLSKKMSIVIIIALVLSFSLVGYIGILCVIILLLLKSRRFILCLFLSILLSMFFFNTIPPVKARMQSTYQVLTNKCELNQTNQSTFTLLLNTLVTLDVLESGDFLFGRGLGSHETSYNAYIKKSNISGPPKYVTSGYLLNKADANSLFLRLLSETGLIGLILFFWFIIKNYIYERKYVFHYLWIINNSILILFIIRLIRQGNYFSEGFFFFIWLYYFSKKLIKENHTNEVLLVKDENTY